MLKINKNWCFHYQKLVIASFFIVTGISTTLQAKAQVTSDGTIGTRVNGSMFPCNASLCTITGGTVAGNNLFHSLKDFSVFTGRATYFNNLPTIENIITRVTGNSVSNIDGLIRANGAANLFLLNPNGIIFGANAQLNIGGSFIASTASGINFAGNRFFSATDTQTTPLLSMSVPMGLQFGNNPKSIINKSVATFFGLFPVGLQVSDGKTLALVGGDVTLAGGRLTALGGRIEIGSVGAGETVALTPVAEGWALGYDGVKNFQNITLTDKAKITSINLGDRNAGDISLKGRQVILGDGAAIASGTFSQGKGASINIDASDLLQISGTGNTELFAQVLNGDLNSIINIQDGIYTGNLDTGASGDIAIATRRLAISNGAGIATLAYGEGAGGNLTVTATDAIEIFGTGISSGLLPPTDTLPISLPKVINGLATLGKAGDGGNLRIDTKQLILRDGVGAVTVAYGTGKGGNLTVNASDLINLDGRSALATVSLAGTGNAGELKVTTKQLTAQHGSAISSSTFSDGNAGNLQIDTEHLIVRYRATIASSALLSRLTEFPSTSTTGQGGDLIVNASDFIELSEGGSLQSQAESLGNSGNITVNTNKLTIQGFRSGISTGTLGDGKSGDLTINASEFIQITGTSPGAFTPTEEVPSLVFQSRTERSRFITGVSTANYGGAGNAGNLTINTPHLTIQDGAGALSSTLGAGQGGNLTVSAFNINLVGRSGLATATFGIGKAGDLKITTSQLNVQDGAFLSADTLSSGNAGNLQIDARLINVLSGARIGAGTSSNSRGQGGNLTIYSSEYVGIKGTSADGTVASGLFVNTAGTGTAGNLRVSTSQLLVQDGGKITAATTGRADAGAIEINAGHVGLSGLNSSIFASTNSAGNGGKVTVSANSLSVSDSATLDARTAGSGSGGSISINANIFNATSGGQIITTAFNQGQAGGITLNATDQVNLLGSKSGLFANTATNSTGDGGSIVVKAKSFFANQGAQIQTSTFGTGNAGNIQVSADAVNLSGTDASGQRTGLYAITAFSGQGGSITVDSNTFSLSDSAVIDARTTGSGRGGSISINANSFDANSNGQIITTAFNQGQAGNITLQVIDRITLSGSGTGLFANTAPNSTGDGGSIFIDPIEFTITDGAGVAVNSLGTGDGGNIKIQAGLLNLDGNAFISATTANGEGGNITLQIQEPARNSSLLLMRHNSFISATAGGTGNGGNIFIIAPYAIAVLAENNDITARAVQGQGGNINITTQGIFGFRFGKELTPDSDINASSEFGLNGSVFIDTLRIDPSQGLIQLPALNNEPPIVVGCQLGGGGKNSLIMTGTSGLPTNPTESLSSNQILDDLGDSLTLEAQGIVKNSNGQMILVAASPCISH